MENQKNMIVAEVQLIYKSKVSPKDRPKITTSTDAFKVLQEHWNFEIIEFIEEFKVILLNRANKVLGLIDISLGGMSACVVDPKVVFASALKSASSSIILVHNHPSGNLSPSQADIVLSSKIKAGGLLLDIAVLDHIILAKEGFYSFADNGMI